MMDALGKARWNAESGAERWLQLMDIHKVEKPDCMLFDCGVMGQLVYVRCCKRRHEAHWVANVDVVQIEIKGERDG